MGPLWTDGEEDVKRLRLKLKAAKNLVPYIKLVENNKLRLPPGSEEAKYDEFFSQEEADRLFHALVVDKLTISQILLLLRERPLSTGEISEILGLSPSEVSRYLNSSARQGLISLDENQGRFVPA